MRVYPFYDDNGNLLDYVQVSRYFTLGEFRNACFSLSSENIRQVPIPQNLLYAMDYLRDKIGQPIHINSHFRTIAHEKRKGRSGNSQHTLGKAVDLSGQGLVALIETAVKERNEVYYKLRDFGINAIGIYDNFVHIDTRSPKVSGDLYYWNKKGDSSAKKKDDDDAPIDWGKGLILLLILVFINKHKK